MLPGFLKELDVDPAPILASAGINGPIDANAERAVVRAQVRAILDESARVLGHGTIGLDLGRRADPSLLGLTGTAFFDGVSLRHCLLSHARFMPTLQSGVRLELAIRGGKAYWFHELTSGNRSQDRILYEGAAAFTVLAIRHVIGHDWSPSLIGFPHRAGRPPQIYEDFFGAPVQFEAGREAFIAFDADLLQAPNRRLGLAKSIQRIVSPGEVTRTKSVDIDESELSEEQLLESIGAIVDSMMTMGSISLPRAAEILGYPLRTFQRRVARSGTSFEEITDGRRRIRAAQLLNDAGLTISDVALALGYSDAAHFIRAFRRWYGVTPSLFRAASNSR